jgi:hypothetical protein
MGSTVDRRADRDREGERLPAVAGADCGSALSLLLAAGERVALQAGRSVMLGGDKSHLNL